MIYSIWEGEGITLTAGEVPPRLQDGRRQDETAVKVAQFEADSWEAACKKMHERYGFEPYITGTVPKQS